MLKKLSLFLGVMGLTVALWAQNPSALTNPSSMLNRGVTSQNPNLLTNPSSMLDRGVTSNEDYKIQPLDVLSIYVFDIPRLTLDIGVNASGTIDYFFFKNLPVRGKTLSQVALELENLLRRDYVVDPQVVVSIKEYRERTIFVMGAVNKPGPVKMPTERDMDILEAIAMAEDFSRVANRKKIDVLRNGRTFKFTFDQLRNVANEKDQFFLRPGDIVNVGESFF